MILKNPDVLVLDEPRSNLNVLNEKGIYTGPGVEGQNAVSGKPPDFDADKQKKIMWLKEGSRGR